MAALQLVGIEQLFTPACKHSLQSFKPARGMPRKIAGFHPHCAYACTLITTAILPRPTEVSSSLSDFPRCAGRIQVSPQQAQWYEPISPDFARLTAIPTICCRHRCRTGCRDLDTQESPRIRFWPARYRSVGIQTPGRTLGAG